MIGVPGDIATSSSSTQVRFGSVDGAIRNSAPDIPFGRRELLRVGRSVTVVEPPVEGERLLMVAELA